MPIKDSTNEAQMDSHSRKPTINTYEDKLNNSKTIRSPFTPNNQEEEEEDDDNLGLYRFECESGDGEEIDDNSGKTFLSK